MGHFGQGRAMFADMLSRAMSADGNFWDNLEAAKEAVVSDWMAEHTAESKQRDTDPPQSDAGEGEDDAVDF